MTDEQKRCADHIEKARRALNNALGLAAETGLTCIVQVHDAVAEPNGKRVDVYVTPLPREEAEAAIERVTAGEQPDEYETYAAPPPRVVGGHPERGRGVTIGVKDFVDGVSAIAARLSAERPVPALTEREMALAWRITVCLAEAEQYVLYGAGSGPPPVGLLRAMQERRR